MQLREGLSRHPFFARGAAVLDLALPPGVGGRKRGNVLAAYAPRP
jgi:hypothetical protein